MKIAILTTGFNVTAKEAANITVKYLVKGLAKNNEVSVITCRRGKDLRFEKFENAEIFRKYTNPNYPKFKYNIFGILFWITKHILLQPLTIKKIKKEFDIIHGFSSAPIAILRSIISKRYCKNVKIVHTIKSHPQHGYKFVKLLNFADIIIVPSEIIKKKLIHEGCKAGKIVLIHSWINLDKFKPQPQLKLKKKYGYENKLIILYYGHLNEFKGIDTLLDTAKLLLNHTKIKIILASSSTPEFNQKYAKRIEEEKIKNIELITKNIVIEEYVNLADIIVLPYPNLISTEANPSCLLEAMATKTPVITTNLPELKEIITHEKHAILVDPNNSESLKMNILRLLSNKELKNTLIHHAYEKAQEFDMHKIIKQHQKVYKQLIEKETNRIDKEKNEI